MQKSPDQESAGSRALGLEIEVINFIAESILETFPVFRFFNSLIVAQTADSTDLTSRHESMASSFTNAWNSI